MIEVPAAGRSHLNVRRPFITTVIDRSTRHRELQNTVGLVTERLVGLFVRSVATDAELAEVLARAVRGVCR
jgi:hypothetical protein